MDKADKLGKLDKADKTEATKTADTEFTFDVKKKKKVESPKESPIIVRAADLQE